MIQVVLIAAGYLTLIWASGWLGLVAAAVHIGVLCVGAGMLKKKHPADHQPNP